MATMTKTLSVERDEDDDDIACKAKGGAARMETISLRRTACSFGDDDGDDGEEGTATSSTSCRTDDDNDKNDGAVFEDGSNNSLDIVGDDSSSCAEAIDDEKLHGEPKRDSAVSPPPNLRTRGRRGSFSSFGGRCPDRGLGRGLSRTMSEVCAGRGRGFGGRGAARNASAGRGLLMQGIDSQESIQNLIGYVNGTEEKAETTKENRDESGEDVSSEKAAEEEKPEYLDLPEQGLLEEGQNYLAMSMLVYIYALLREMAVLGYTEVDFRAIDVNRWVRWYENPTEDSDDETVSTARSGPGEDDDRSTAMSTVCSRRRTRRECEKYLQNTRTAGNIIRCVLEELEMEYQRAKEEHDEGGSTAKQHDISVAKEFQHWVDDSRSDQPDNAAEQAIKELQRQVAKKRWKRAVETVMARSRFKFILAATKAAKEVEREEREGKPKDDRPKEESVREKMERKKQAVRRQLQKEMRSGSAKGGVNSWFTLQKRVIESHFDDETEDVTAEAKEENAKRRPDKNMIDTVVEQSLPSFFKPGSVLNLMMEQGIEVVYFGDRHPNEAIYCLCVCRSTRTVTVIFRGSVTAHNWMYNMKLMMSKQPNPLAREQYEGRSDNVLLHTGFGLYMLRRRKDTGKTKIDEICERIDQVGRELAPDGRYRVSVTGHSLGGALSTIFSFYAACQKRFTTLGPVRTFTFAAPRVGDERFRSAYERLERTGRLRHARFSNIKDIVPLTPTFSLNGTRIGPWYKHVGLQVKLHETNVWGKQMIRKSIDATYPLCKTWWAEVGRALGSNNFLFNLTSLKGFGKNHSLSEHQRRLNFTYQFRRNMLVHDKNDKKMKIKSMEEYYRIKAGIGSMPEVTDGKGRGKFQKRAVVVIVAVSFLSVLLVYVLVTACPFGDNWRTGYCTEGGWKFLCKGIVPKPRIYGELEGATAEVDPPAGMDLADVVPEEAVVSKEDGASTPAASSGDAEVDPLAGMDLADVIPEEAAVSKEDGASTPAASSGDERAEKEPTSANVTNSPSLSDVDSPEGSVEDLPSKSDESYSAPNQVQNSTTKQLLLLDDKGCACLEAKTVKTVTAAAADRPGWGFSQPRAPRRSASVLDLAPAAQQHAESFAKTVEQEARLVARAKTVPLAVEVHMASMAAPGEQQDGGGRCNLLNTPGQVLGPLLLHVATRVFPFLPYK